MKNSSMQKGAGILCFIFMIILFSSIVQAADLPMLPSFFYGKATINGRDVPINSVVTAKMNSENRGEIKVTVAGRYGDENTDNKIGVTGDRSSISQSIEFYVNLPGMQPIKAAQMGVWSSGTVANLDLTFTGQEIPVPVEQDSETSGATGGTASGTTTGGGAGAPAGGASPSQAPVSMMFYYDLIEAGNQRDISLSNPNIPVTKVQLLLSYTVGDVDLKLAAVESTEGPVLDNVYKYIEIYAPKINESSIKTAIIKFTIPTKWFTDNNYDPDSVKLFRYHDDRWTELTTIHEGLDNTYHYYRASTPGFSYFAIISEKNPEVEDTSIIVPEEETKPAAVALEPQEIKEEGIVGKNDNSDNSITGFAAKEVNKGKADVLTALLIGTLVVIVGYYIYDKRKVKKTYN